MRKYFVVLFLFSFISLFSMETVITPIMGYTNYFSSCHLHTKKRIDTYLHTFTLGLDLMFMGEQTGFTFFANNHLSFMDETQVFGDVDFVRGKGASIVEGMFYDASWLVGYTIDFTEDLKLRLGIGSGFFHGYRPKNNTTSTAAGCVFLFCLDYFFIHGLGISFGLEEGVYGKIRKNKPNEKLVFFNRVQIKLGLAIRS